MTAIDILDDESFLGAESFFNIFTLKRNSGAATDEDRATLDTVGQFHLGEYVNRFRYGSLVMKLADTSESNEESMEGENNSTYKYGTIILGDKILYGSVNGAIGVIAKIDNQSQYSFLQDLQESCRGVIKGIGGFDHREWRAFSDDRKTSESVGFIDGDLIESYLDLKPEKMQQVAKTLSQKIKVDITVEQLSKIIQTLQQSTH